jgi:hypothetical protein
VVGGTRRSRGNLASDRREQQVRVHRSRRRGTTPLNSRRALEMDCCLTENRIGTLQKGIRHTGLGRRDPVLQRGSMRFGEKMLFGSVKNAHSRCIRTGGTLGISEPHVKVDLGWSVCKRRSRTENLGSCRPPARLEIDTMSLWTPATAALDDSTC